VFEDGQARYLDPRAGAVRQSFKWAKKPAPLYSVCFAPDGLTSDALDTPICILGAERGLKMASGQPGVHAWTSWIEAKRRKRAWTERFPDFVVPAEE